MLELGTLCELTMKRFPRLPLAQDFPPGAYGTDTNRLVRIRPGAKQDKKRIVVHWMDGLDAGKPVWWAKKDLEFLRPISDDC